MTQGMAVQGLKEDKKARCPPRLPAAALQPQLQGRRWVSYSLLAPRGSTNAGAMCHVRVQAWPC